MTEKIEIKNGKVNCPMIKEQTAARICKHCQHCRIAMNDNVKCTYKDDMYKLQHPYVYSV